MISLFIVAAIALSVAIGYKTKYNTGFFAIVFAYVIGCFVMMMKPKEVISGWPVSTMFVIMAVSLFYNFALVNGTLERQPDIFFIFAGVFLDFFPLLFMRQVPELPCWERGFLL
mgnify:CR=1 FL=1